MGKNETKRVPLVARWIGLMLKKGALGEKPFGKNSPTDKSFICVNEHVFDEERLNVIKALEEFRIGGHAKCTKDPHPFFGEFTPDQWARIQWKHLDHHLRQFGA